MAGQLLRRRCPLGLGRHRDRFGQRAAMQVVNLLRVRGVAHHAAPHRPLTQVDFLAQHRHDRQDRPCPVGRVLQLPGAAHQPHADLGPQNLAFALDQAGGPQIFQRARLGLFLVFGADNLAVGQAQQRAVNIVLIPVFRDAEFLAAVTKPTGRDAVPAIPCLGPGLGPAALKLALGQHLRDEDVSRVLARRHLRPRIPNDRKRRENRSDSDIQIPRIVRCVFSRDAPMAHAADRRMFQRLHVGDIRKRLLFDVADKASIDFRDLAVGPIIDRPNADRRRLDAGIIHDLVDVLR